MFNLPREIQEKIFSFDPTYRILFDLVLFQFKKCHSCKYDLRKEIRMWNSDYWKSISRSPVLCDVENYGFCCKDCYFMVNRIDDGGRFHKVLKMDYRNIIYEMNSYQEETNTDSEWSDSEDGYYDYYYHQDY